MDGLLNEEMMCDITLPHLLQRSKLEASGMLQPRQSVLEDEFEYESEVEESTAETSIRNTGKTVTSLCIALK